MSSGPITGYSFFRVQVQWNELFHERQKEISRIVVRWKSEFLIFGEQNPSLPPSLSPSSCIGLATLEDLSTHHEKFNEHVSHLRSSYGHLVKIILSGGAWKER